MMFAVTPDLRHLSVTMLHVEVMLSETINVQEVYKISRRRIRVERVLHSFGPFYDVTADCLQRVPSSEHVR